MKKINITGSDYPNSEIKVNVIKENKLIKLIKKYALFALIGVLFWISLYIYSLSVNKENKTLINIKEAIQNLDSANQNSLNIIKREQEMINQREIQKEKLKDKLNKIVNKYNPLGWLVTKTYADEENINDILDAKIVKFCNAHEKANDKFWEDGMNVRCALILQSIYRFETGNLKSYVGNNIFNFRSPGIKCNRGEKYGIKTIRGGFLVFPDRTSSIKFAVDRFYKYDRYKTIKQIISGGKYCSPVTGKCSKIPGFTFTGGDCENYISFVRKYYKDNILIIN